MNVIYSKNYNIHLGLLNYLHPFDGMKFRTIFNSLKLNKDINFIEPNSEVNSEIINNFLSSMMRKKVRDRVFIFRALEVPKIPFITFAFLDRKILNPMRWGVAGTLLAAEKALSNGETYWNLAGGYHHAMPQNMEGFCIYNDIGICYQQLIKNGTLSTTDKILIIDTDAHHGNGNAYTFMDNKQVTILDIYNAGIYPTSGFTRDRVDIAAPLPPGTDGENYLQQYQAALEKIKGKYRLAFVVAGTDTLLSDRLGGLCLTIDDVVEREQRTLRVLNELAIPTVMLGGGGYSKDSARSIIRSISACAETQASEN